MVPEGLAGGVASDQSRHLLIVREGFRDRSGLRADGKRARGRPGNCSDDRMTAFLDALVLGLLVFLLAVGFVAFSVAWDVVA